MHPIFKRLLPVLTLALTLTLLARPSLTSYAGCSGGITFNVTGITADDILESAILSYNTCTSAADTVTAIVNGLTDVDFALTPINNVNGATLVIEGGTLDGEGTQRLLQMTNGKLILRDMTLENAILSGSGGALAISGGIVTIEKSTIRNNTITGISNFGAGIYVTGSGQLTLKNSTVYNNIANSSASGGGLAVNGINAQATIKNSTFNANSGLGGGNLYMNGSANVTLHNSIFANSISGADCFNDTTATVIFSTGRSNVIETNTDCGGIPGVDWDITDPALGTLTGDPAYYPITTSSPAYNVGDNGVCLADDIVGTVRPQASNCSVGAFEVPLCANKHRDELCPTPDSLQHL
jgi:hypothetical protein